MNRNELIELQNAWLEAKKALERDGGRDNATKRVYYHLQSRLYGLKVEGVQSGDVYQVIDVTEADNMPMLVLLRSDGAITQASAGNLIPCIGGDGCRISC